MNYDDFFEKNKIYIEKKTRIMYFLHVSFNCARRSSNSLSDIIDEVFFLSFINIVSKI